MPPPYMGVGKPGVIRPKEGVFPKSKGLSTVSRKLSTYLGHFISLERNQGSPRYGGSRGNPWRW